MVEGDQLESLSYEISALMSLITNKGYLTDKGYPV